MSTRQARPFVRLDVDVAGNPKVLDVPVAARWLWVVSITVAGRNLTDGHVRRGVVVAEAEATDKAAASLVKAGLWHEPGHGCPRCPQPASGHVVIHDYAEHQQTRADVEERAAVASERGRKAARARWHGAAETEPTP